MKDYEQLNPETEAKINEILEECERVERVAKSVCPHAQYCGDSSNDYYGNGTPHKFICRKNMLAYKRHDGLIMMEPFTDNELVEAFKQYCVRHYGETCKTVDAFSEGER